MKPSKVRRLAYHKAAAEHLATRRWSTLFILAAPATRRTWDLLKARSSYAPYIGYLPDAETGDLPDPKRVDLPRGARECVILNSLGLKRAQLQSLAVCAHRAGMAPTLCIRPDGYLYRVGERRNG